MEREELRTLLEKVESGQQTAADALSDISLQPDMLVGNYADIDLHRHMRQGMPEVIYGAGKTAEQIVGIASAMKQKGLKNILITRLSEEKADEIAKTLEFSYYSTPQIGIVNEEETEKRGKIVVIAAGTSDLPVAEEAAMTAELYGNQVERVYDVRGGRYPSSFASASGYGRRECHYRSGRYGGGIGQCGRWSGGLSGHRCTDECRLWCKLWRTGGTALNAEFMCEWCQCCEY